MAATSSKIPDAGKLSFAKVAASASKKPLVNNSSMFGTPAPSSASNYPPPLAAVEAKPYTDSKEEDASRKTGDASFITGSVSAVKAAEPIHPTVRLNGSTTVSVYIGKISKSESVNLNSASNPPGNACSIPSQPPSDEVSQRADSNSELGTKPPSLDGKSIASGTTFNALDEKESLRPDDSASVKAATDEDDVLSIRGSLIVNSRLGSDVAARMHRIQIGDMPPRIIAHVQPEQPATAGVATPRSTGLEQQSVTEARVQFATNAAPPDALNGQSPDERLLDAMQTPKDRLFLLRLENDVVNFVQNSKEPFMDLPPSNSFCRMLTHKLADYYHMTHSFEADAGSVRIFRTPFCRVPPPLATLVTTTTPSSSTPPPMIQPRKIMRRGEEGELSISAGPSKPTSEVGSDLKDKSTPAKELMSREEREEAYNKARERIFGSSMATESSTPENDDSTGISRASSLSGKDKGSIGKGKGGKKRRDDSESFDSRSQYTPYYNHPQQPTWMPPQYLLAASNGQYVPGPATINQTQLPILNQQQTQQISPQHQQQPGSFPGIQPQLVYNNTAAAYSSVPSTNVAGAHTSTLAQHPSQPVSSRYQSQTAPPAFPYAPISGSQWQTPAFSQGSHPGVPPRPLPAHQTGVPYAFGQLPANANPGDPKTQHPIPGSYAGHCNRHGFNPQTQSFVPRTGTIPGPTMPPSSQSQPQMHCSAPRMHGQTVTIPLHGQPQVAGFPNSIYQQKGPQYDGVSSRHGIGPRQGSINSTAPGTSYVPPQTGPVASGTFKHMAPGNVPGPLPGPGPRPVSNMHNGVPQGPRNHGLGCAPNLAPPFHTSTPSRGHALGNFTHNQNNRLGPQAAAGFGPKNSSTAGSVSSTFSFLPNYGNPATLPQKPATAAELRH